MILRIFTVFGLVIASLLSIFAYNAGWFKTQDVQQFFRTAATSSPQRAVKQTATQVDFTLELDRMSASLQERKQKIVYATTKPEPSAAAEMAQTGFYSQPVAVASTEYRERNRRAAHRRIASIQSENRALGAAKFERIMAAANRTELARIQSETGYAMR